MCSPPCVILVVSTLFSHAFWTLKVNHMLKILLQGIYRKPKQCRERHKFLSEQLGTEIQENSDDLSPLQPSNAQSPGIPKVNNTRALLQRMHGSVEEDTLKVHLEQIVLTWEKLCPWKPTDTREQKGLTAPHPSHGIAISQFCTGGTPK
jgi:hypothetical protein